MQTYWSHRKERKGKRRDHNMQGEVRTETGNLEGKKKTLKTGVIKTALLKEPICKTVAPAKVMNNDKMK